MKKPIVSLIIPTYNEEKNIYNCLKSIRRQNFPNSNYEIIVVDDTSTDETVEIAKKFNAKVILHDGRHGEIGKMIGFRAAKGRYAMYLDADVELRGRKWFQKMLRPLDEDSEIIASFTYEGAREKDSPLERYYSFDPLQRDTIYSLFSTSIQETVERKENGYLVCKYSKNKIPPSGRCLYRRQELLKKVKDYSLFLELDFLRIMVESGYNKFAYVYSAGLYHHHAKNLNQLLKKRRYNVKKVYLANYSKRLYTWFDLKNPKDVLKLFLLIFYANTFLFSIIAGVYKSFRHKDWAGMYEPIVSFSVTNQILFAFITDARFFKLIK